MWIAAGEERRGEERRGEGSLCEMEQVGQHQHREDKRGVCEPPLKMLGSCNSKTRSIEIKSLQYPLLTSGMWMFPAKAHE
ncbi:hypothetical protein L1987_59511 [Smallanthus sonchifolius]|uniref:Uncharacterized protein n=1 Tax=Smallanthus sonchifolius TaxID=185202 RepID=A0ACB9D5E9_9ASTR|nr:hypothetical protein L1987_59511 [Smallanthus sonchifolius]